jgi:nucleotide-binding universal stress UspA family protein
LNILLAVDNSPHSQVAVDVVLNRNWPNETTFRVFCAVERREPVFAVMQREEAEAFLNKALKAAEDFTKEIADQLALQFPNCTATNEAQFGDSKEIILEKSDWADLIVVGSHGRHGLPRFFLGSVSQTILLHGQCSTLIARNQKTQLSNFDNNILIAIDETPHSQRALEWVLKLPWSNDARFTLLSVITPPEVAQTAGSDAIYVPPDPAALKQQKESVSNMLEECADRLEEKVGIGKVNIEIKEGDSVDIILSMATSMKAGLIVMGSRTRGQAVRFFMGSVSQEVVLKAPCPVEIVKRVSI